jgi:hypothetical protein
MAVTETSVTQRADGVRLRHALAAVYVRDDDPHSIGLRRLKRTRDLTAEQRQAYKRWLDEQRKDGAA